MNAWMTGTIYTPWTIAAALTLFALAWTALTCAFLAFANAADDPGLEAPSNVIVLPVSKPFDWADDPELGA